MRATPRAPAVNDRGMGLPFSGRLVARQMAALDLSTFATFHRHVIDRHSNRGGAPPICRGALLIS